LRGGGKPAVSDELVALAAGAPAPPRNSS